MTQNCVFRAPFVLVNEKTAQKTLKQPIFMFTYFYLLLTTLIDFHIERPDSLFAIAGVGVPPALASGPLGRS